MTNLSIIILNYNLTEDVSNCIKSLVGVDAEIIVVDNNSPDRSIEQLAQEFPHVRFLFLNTNLGFAHGNNEAVKSVTTEYIYILNPDTTTDVKSIEKLLSYFADHPDAAITCPMLIHPNGSQQFSYNKKLGLWWELAEAFFLPNYIRNKQKKQHEPMVRAGQAFEVDWAAGAALMIRKSVYEQIQGFDENFFLMYEDIDLCDRIRKLGYKIVFIPDAVVIHKDSGIIGKNFKRLVTNRYWARLIYIKKHYNSIQRFLTRFIHIIGLIIRIAISPFVYKGKERNERLSGYIESLLVYMFFKRNFNKV